MPEKNNTPSTVKSSNPQVSPSQVTGLVNEDRVKTHASSAADTMLKLRYKRTALDKVLIIDTDFVLIFDNGRKVLI